MGRKDERSGTNQNNTTDGPGEAELGKSWVLKHSGKSGAELAKEAEKLYNQREAGKNDRN